jgi:hypothetical protein
VRIAHPLFRTPSLIGAARCSHRSSPLCGLSDFFSGFGAPILRDLKNLPPGIVLLGKYCYNYRNQKE